MRDKWYGDQLDLLKWGGVAQLVEAEGAGLVVQVAYYRSDEEKFKLKTRKGGCETENPLDETVVKHFKGSVKCIENLRLPASIEVFEEPWDGSDRSSYHGKLKGWLADKRCDARVVLLLDPDTGLMKDDSATAVHVKHSDLVECFGLLSEGDVLALYQHRPQGEKHAELLEKLPGRIAQALRGEGVTDKDVTVISSDDLPRNAVLAAVVK